MPNKRQPFALVLFEGWKLVELVNFRVRLKAEFLSSNRDLYKEEAVKLS